jgi:hypothetical protein
VCQLWQRDWEAEWIGVSPLRLAPDLHREETRHGVVTWYRAALEGVPPSKAVKAYTLAWTLNHYRNSSAWTGLATSTRR